MFRTPLRRRRALGVCFSVLLSMSFLATADVAARELVPTPPGGGSGTTMHLPDQELPPGDPSLDPQELEQRFLAAMVERDLPMKRLATDGGDDITVMQHPYVGASSMDIASNGDIYVAVEVFNDPDLMYSDQIRVYRSLDRGSTWEEWGRVPAIATGDYYEEPSLHIAEGTVNRCFVAYEFKTLGVDASIELIAGDLSDPSPDFSSSLTALQATDVWMSRPCLTSDAAAFGSFYLYLVAEGYDGAGADIWFARSINQGSSFESGYRIGELTLNDRHYRRPTVSYGYNGTVHVSWDFTHTDDAWNGAMRYRRALSYANGGLSAWQSIYGITLTSDADWNWVGRVRAALDTNEVLVVYGRDHLLDSGTMQPLETGLKVSTDGGASFGAEVILDSNWISPNAVLRNPTTGVWFFGGARGTRPEYCRTTGSDPTVWNAPESLYDEYSTVGPVYPMSTALDPSDGYRVAQAWPYKRLSSEIDDLRFDAEWRDDPGYPVAEPGFPVDLDQSPVSDPAVVDVDGDGDLEIVYASLEYVHVLHHDGTPLSGWPVYLLYPSDGPVAVGDLNGDGEMSVVVGTVMGTVYAYSPEGELLPGWPYTMPVGEPVSVSIGALGGPYRRTVVATAGNRLKFLDYAGDSPLGTFGWIFASDVVGPAAIGDVDGDGVSEAVFGTGDRVVALDLYSASKVFDRTVGAEVSAAVSLGDFDGDGDVETVVPTTTGDLYVLNGDGTNYPGAWPFSSSSGSMLNSAAIAQCLGTGEPEIAVSAKNWTVHMIYETGVEHSGYPEEPDAGWYVYSSPIVGRVDGSSSDVVIGSRSKRGWAWSNIGATCGGWPRELNDYVYHTAAMGDLDLDGSNELVFFTLSQLWVFDVNNLPNDATRTWAMFAHDPQRTGCADCPEDVVTAVGPTATGITRVSFAAPHPNPSSGTTVFQYAVPVRARVELEIFDLRGRRVSQVVKEEAGPGPFTVSWDGLDRRGVELASGPYFARLRVRGPGLDETLTRKLTLLR